MGNLFELQFYQSTKELKLKITLRNDVVAGGSQIIRIVDHGRLLPFDCVHVGPRLI